MFIQFVGYDMEANSRIYNFDVMDPVWSKYSTGRFSARSRMMYGHHAKEKMGAVVGLAGC
jgi:hypothetical protein